MRTKSLCIIVGLHLGCASSLLRAGELAKLGTQSLDAHIEYGTTNPLLENGGPFGALYRSGNINRAISIGYVLSDGTARGGVDYIPLAGTITFAPGETLKEPAFPNPTIDNGTVDGTRTVFVTLTNASAGVSFRSSPIEVSIFDNELANSFDRSFSVNGDSSKAYLLSVQSDGGLFANVLESQTGELKYVRLLANGALDPDFHSALGHVSASIPLADGKLLVITDQSVYRLNGDGSIDRSFTFDSGLAASYTVSAPILEMPDKRLLVTITDKEHLTNANGLVCLQADGQLDSSFSPIARILPRIISMIALRADGILIGGTQILDLPEASIDNAVFLESSHSNGYRDFSFSPPQFKSNGQVSLINFAGDRLLIQADQKILVSGAFDSVNALPRTNLVRLLPDGSVDRGFLAPPVRADTPILLQPDGHLLVLSPYSEGMGIKRLNPDGSLDRHFPLGVTGRLATIQSQPDGCVLASGRFESGDRFINIPAGELSPFSRGIARFNLAQTDTAAVEFAADHLCALGDVGCNAYKVELPESDSNVVLKLLRLGPTASPYGLKISPRGSATPNVDYVQPARLLSFAPLEVEKRLTFKILDDAKPELNEDIQIELEQKARSIGSSFTIAILDNEPSRAFTGGPSLLSPNGPVTLDFTAPATEVWHLEASTDFQKWSREGFSNLSYAGAVIRRWLDPQGGGSRVRFYRAVRD